MLTGAPWRWMGICWGGLAVLAACLILAAWRGARWPVMSGQPAPELARQVVVAAVAPDDPAALWDSLSQGIDPTQPGRPGTGRE